MKYIFGPVPSRRLGRSLGIDPVPLKTCNWNCVYCQLGRTRPLTNSRREYFPRHEILIEAEQALVAHQPGQIDWVTFVGSGEPTLYEGLGWLIRKVKEITQLPVAVITNGSLLHLPEVRGELSAANAVLPSLDAGNPDLYRKINRPWPKLTFEAYLQGLIAFRYEYTGQLWIEIMLVKGLNDTDQALQEIAAALNTIRPDQIHLMQPVRPPAESWVQPPDKDGLERAQAILGDVANATRPYVGKVVAQCLGSLEATILGIITRHPMPEEELCALLGRYSPGEVSQALVRLQKAGKAKQITRQRKRFWSAAESSYDGEHLETGDYKK